MNLTSATAHFGPAKSVILQIVAWTVMFGLSSCSKSDSRWLLNAERTLKRVDTELHNHYRSIDGLILKDLAEVSKRIQTNESVHFEIQYTIGSLDEYRLLFDRREKLIASTKQYSFNPLIAYIDGKEIGRDYWTSLTLDGAVGSGSRSMLPKALEEAAAFLSEAKSDNSVQERPLSDD
jgi:hypothetical protein